jgi:hypothetical protein
LYILIYRLLCIKDFELNGSKHVSDLICSKLLHKSDFDSELCTKHLNYDIFRGFISYLYDDFVLNSGNKTQTNLVFSAFLFMILMFLPNKLTPWPTISLFRKPMYSYLVSCFLFFYFSNFLLYFLWKYLITSYSFHIFLT